MIIVFTEFLSNYCLTQSNGIYFERCYRLRSLLKETSPQNFLISRQNRASCSSVYCAGCIFVYGQNFVRISYSNPMSMPFSIGPDVHYPSKHTRSTDCLLKDSQIAFEFSAISSTRNSLLLDANAPKLVNFLFLDVESAKLKVLKAENHQAFYINYLLVEYGDYHLLNVYLEKQRDNFIDKLSIQNYLFAAEELGGGDVA